MVVHYVCIVGCMLLLICQCFSQKPAYVDLETLGANCPPGDTCSSSMERNFRLTSCECDPECVAYDDCCIDAPDEDEDATPRADLVCVPTADTGMGVYVINKCEEGWQGEQEIQDQCETENNFSDPLASAPVTDTITGLSYKNWYCAECNNADLEMMLTWLIKIHCKSLEKANHTHWNITNAYILEHLTYDTSLPQQNKWGLFYWNDVSKKDEFHTCNIFFDIPDYLEDFGRYCRPNLVSTCAPDYGRESVRNACPTYMAVVRYPSAIYRNIHCAMCNNERLENATCGVNVIGRGNKRTMSFTLLLDINMADGSRVGEVDDTRCESHEKWDPFFSVCREVVCGLPGLHLENGRCVRD